MLTGPPRSQPTLHKQIPLGPTILIGLGRRVYMNLRNPTMASFSIFLEARGAIQILRLTGAPAPSTGSRSCTLRLLLRSFLAGQACTTHADNVTLSTAEASPIRPIYKRFQSRIFFSS